VNALPENADEFAADALLAGITVGQQAVAGRNDRQAQATLDARQVLVADIGAAAGTADALDVLDDLLALGAVLQGQTQEAR
jgi:hypothetical protein